MGAIGKAVWEAVAGEFAELGDPAGLFRLVVRMLTAAAMGGMLGYTRQRIGRPAGIRTHMLVALGAAAFVAVPEQAGMTMRELSRVIQGVITGLGFLGAGAILKLDRRRQIKGLTSAAGIWLTASVGLASGLGRIVSAILLTLMALMILIGLRQIEQAMGLRAATGRPARHPGGSPD